MDRQIEGQTERMTYGHGFLDLAVHTDSKKVCAVFHYCFCLFPVGTELLYPRKIKEIGLLNMHKDYQTSYTKLNIFFYESNAHLYFISHLRMSNIHGNRISTA